MPKMTLEDGRVVDVERKPTVQEKVLMQTQYRKAFKTPPTDMPDVMQSVDWSAAVPLFVTLHRGGVGERMPDLMDDDRMNYWYGRMEIEPGETADDESEDEQSPDPSSASEVGEGNAPEAGTAP